MFTYTFFPIQSIHRSKHMVKKKNNDWGGGGAARGITRRE